MPPRSLLSCQIIIISLIIPTIAVFFAYQASIRWEGFKGVVKRDWESNFRALVEAGEKAHFGGNMGGKTPVYLYVWICLGLLGFVLLGVYELTRMEIVFLMAV